MRTAIFMGLFYIGDAIGKPSYLTTGSDVVAWFAFFFMAFLVMDVVDFIRGRK